ncbi:MAG: protein-L-isoaspartate(D-aspartate) O-methyltransferase [Deltaproteobacteria bacterium]|nr:protein-L-isoaspartate(D-aspartate) O-methyltransferase [Deltaproteobacteria bacterium]
MEKIFRILIVLLLLCACRLDAETSNVQHSAGAPTDPYAQQREQMVRNQIEARGVRDRLVLDAMRKVHRHLFVPGHLTQAAYLDFPLPIGEGQTISQPYIVAFMTESLQLKGGEKALEIGTGSGYQAAVLAEIAKEVYTIEIIPSLGNRAKALLKAMGCENIHVRIGDGYRGWREHAPYDAIIVTAAPPSIPKPLVDQLKPGGRMVIPVGESFQELILITKGRDGAVGKKSLLPVRFVPMTGEVQEKK